jgi:hypothetical protein
MNTIQPTHSVINRSLTPAKLVVATYDNMVKTRKPFGQMRLSIAPRNGSSVLPGDPVITPSGSFAFFNLVGGSYTIRMTAIYYLEKQVEIDLPLPGGAPHDDNELTIGGDAETMFAAITLLPSPAYILLPGMTVIRVLFRRAANKQPISGGLLYALRNNGGTAVAVFVGRTDRNGQAILCCNRLTRESILQINGFDFNGPRQFQLRAHDIESGLEVEQTVVIREFWSNDLIIELS